MTSNGNAARAGSTERPQRIHRYDTPAADSGRWDHYRKRAGDIVVATPPKCGTTWTQMLCALLVHQMPVPPQPLTKLSRWLDRHAQPIETVIAEFEAQDFRRIIKTHTPLDGLPYFDDVTYVVCGRDPRDAALSMMDHFQNLSPESIAAARSRAGLPPDFQLPNDADTFFRMWISHGDQPWTWDGFPVGTVIYFLHSFLVHRTLPNIVFLHYSDLRADLDGEMRRLSARLGIPIDEARWPALVRAATFAAMKDKAEDNAPGAHLNEWTSNSDFFRKGRMGEWRQVLSAENLAHYDTLMTEKLSPPLRAWIEGGRAAAGDPRAF